MSELRLTTQQIGRAGELLVQYRLLKYGIDSAPMTTDSGIDLVAYSPPRAGAITIQVKTNATPKPAGGKGRLALDWWLHYQNTAEILALVHLSGEQVWLFSRQQFDQMAQQRTPDGRLHLYFYVEADYVAKAGCHQSDFDIFSIERQVHSIFGSTVVAPFSSANGPKAVVTSR